MPGKGITQTIYFGIGIKCRMLLEVYLSSLVWIVYANVKISLHPWDSTEIYGSAWDASGAEGSHARIKQ